MSNDLRYEVNKPDVVDESVDGEVLIVHLGTGTYYSSRGAGDAAWQVLASGRTLAEAAGALGQSEGAVEEFLDRLVEDGLLRLREGEAAPLPELRPIDGPLLLEKYTDMQELLLLDPIHDV
ncbi:MAG: PqqD family protein, partial [bacterium]